MPTSADGAETSSGSGGRVDREEHTGVSAHVSFQTLLRSKAGHPSIGKYLATQPRPRLVGRLGTGLPQRSARSRRCHPIHGTPHGDDLLPRILSQSSLLRYSLNGPGKGGAAGFMGARACHVGSPAGGGNGFILAARDGWAV